ncbi:MAG: carbohydrate kinase family protein [Thermoplasmata archaeon]
MPSNHDLLIIGDAVLDISLEIGNFPISKGTTSISPKMEIAPGGPAAMAIIASRLGLKVAFVDKIGIDVPGDYLLRELKESGVNTQHMSRDETAGTAISINLIDSNRDHSFVGHTGAGGMLDSIDETLIKDSKSIFFEGYNLVSNGKTYDTILNAAKHASLNQKLVFFDPGPLISQIVDIQKFIDLSNTVFLNREEALSYSKTSLEETLHILKKMDRVTYVLKLDKGGSKLIKNGKEFSCDAVKIDQINNTIGAGDAYDAGYMAATLSGYSEDIACKAGNIVASMRISKGIKSIPDIAKIVDQVKTL